MKSVEEQLKIIKKGTLDIINEEELIKINDILEEYNNSAFNNNEISIEYDIKSLNYEKKEILELIKRQGNIKIDDICNYTGMDIKTINSNVNELLIDDYIIEMENKTYGFNV